MKKYELTSEAKESMGRTLYRIRALISFGAVVEGNLGGYVEKEENLSHDGNAWVSGDARVHGNARVSSNAWVYGDALVSGDAWVSGDARVSDSARVYGNARVSGDARVHGNARVSGDARVHGNALVSDNARVSGDAWVYGDARVYGDAMRTPINITGLRYNVTITDSHIKIGCEFHSIDEWGGFTDSHIRQMDGNSAIAFWSEHKTTIMALAKSHAESVKAAA